MRRSIALGSIAIVVVAASAALLAAGPAFTQVGLPAGSPVRPLYTAVGVASHGGNGSAAWLLDAQHNRIIVCTHGASNGCARYELP